MVTKEAAREIAQDFVRARLGQELECGQVRLFDRELLLRFAHIAGYTNDTLDEKDIGPYWAVCFEGYFPSGRPMDESLVVRVDAEDGSASFSS